MYLLIVSELRYGKIYLIDNTKEHKNIDFNEIDFDKDAKKYTHENWIEAAEIKQKITGRFAGLMLTYEISIVPIVNLIKYIPKKKLKQALYFIDWALISNK